MTAQQIDTDPPAAHSSHAVLRELLAGYWVSQSIYVAARLGIADLLAASPRGAEELARDTGTHPGALFRLLRALAGLGIVTIDPAGLVHLTALGACLRGDVPGSLRALALWNGEVGYPAWTSAVRAIQTGRPASRDLFGTDQFPFLDAHPDIGALFGEAMAGLAGHLAAAVVAAYDFRPFRRIIDVGGGHGTLLAAILSAAPAAQGVLFDSRPVVDAARESLRAAGLSERCALVAGDFFASVPPAGDLYLLSSILHDWDDERAAAILRVCRQAMPPGARLLVIDCALPTDNRPAFAILLDLQMLMMTGGRERTDGEFERLLAAGGFRLTRVIPTDCPESILEAVPI